MGLLKQAVLRWLEPELSRQELTINRKFSELNSKLDKMLEEMENNRILTEIIGEKVQPIIYSYFDENRNMGRFVGTPSNLIKEAIQASMNIDRDEMKMSLMNYLKQYIGTEPFIDTVVDKIKKKQLQ